MRSVLILAYTFPPDNVVAAMRPVRIARAFSEAGWSVTVAHARDFGKPHCRDVEVPPIEVRPYRPNRLLRYLSRISEGLSARARSVIRRAMVPEHSWWLESSQEGRKPGCRGSSVRRPDQHLVSVFAPRGGEHQARASEYLLDSRQSRPVDGEWLSKIPRSRRNGWRLSSSGGFSANATMRHLPLRRRASFTAYAIPG